MSNKLKNKQLKQIQNQAQEGRSMVEMLGVLAIVGVLSIGGITGYSWGMDKHVANQILNEMNLNSLQLAMLLQKGNPDGVTLALGSPYDDDNPTFQTVNYEFQYGCGDNAEVADPECEYINETRYFITALDLPERVQKMVAESAENLQYAVEVETDETEGFVTVFFDVDPTVEAGIPRPEETEPHYTPMPEVTEPTTTTTTEATTPTTTTTEATTTTESTTTTVTTTTVTTVSGDCSGHGQLLYYSGGDANEKGSFCYCEDGYAGERCEKQEENKECNENTDCGTGQYCYFSSSSSCTEQEGKGKCKSNTPDAKIAVNGKTFFAKFNWMSWWSAKNFCESHTGKQMVSIDGLQCSSESKAQIKSGYGYCYKTRTSGDISDTITELYKKIGGYYWLSDLYDNNSCNAYGVYLHSGGVDGSSRYGSGYRYALCE